MRIGIIVATEKEQLPFIEVFGKPTSTATGGAYNVLMWHREGQKHTICLTRSGYGEIAAASATQYLIDNFNVDKIINYGVAGGLHEELFIKKVGIVRKIVHYGFDLSGNGRYPLGRYPNQSDVFIEPCDNTLPFWAIEKALGRPLPEFVCASADKFVMGGPPKRKLRKKFGADICEMEAAGIVITCNRNDIPCSFIKAISDGVDEDEDAFDRNVYEAAKVCVDVILKIIQVL